MRTHPFDLSLTPNLKPNVSVSLKPNLVLTVACLLAVVLFLLDAAVPDAHFWSRSRQSLWHKGGTSGHVQKVRAIRLDCDRDALVLLVEQIGGAACHTGFRSCFYRELKDGRVSECCPIVFDPKEVYK